jgi:hypothetical protein
MVNPGRDNTVVTLSFRIVSRAKAYAYGIVLTIPEVNTACVIFDTFSFLGGGGFKIRDGLAAQNLQPDGRPGPWQ